MTRVRCFSPLKLGWPLRHHDEGHCKGQNKDSARAPSKNLQNLHKISCRSTIPSNAGISNKTIQTLKAQITFVRCSRADRFWFGSAGVCRRLTRLALSKHTIPTLFAHQPHTRCAAGLSSPSSLPPRVADFSRRCALVQPVLHILVALTLQHAALAL